jgi:hypothetical protein
MIIRTKNNNEYLYNKKAGTISYLKPELIEKKEFFEQNSNENEIYSKVVFL